MSDGQNQGSGRKLNLKDPLVLLAIAIIVLLCVAIVLLAVNLFRGPTVVTAPVAPGGSFDRAAARADRKDGRREEDPYIANQVKNTIIKNYSEIQECYNKYLEDNPSNTDGRVTLDWQIDMDGSVMNPELVGSDFANEKLVNCMIDKIKDYKFPAPPYGRPEYVAHKFLFKKDTGSDKK